MAACPGPAPEPMVATAASDNQFLWHPYMGSVGAISLGTVFPWGMDSSTSLWDSTTARLCHAGSTQSPISTLGEGPPMGPVPQH